MDYNRAGIALLEIVTEPDLESPKEAKIFLQKLSSVLEHLGVCDGHLEGSMRCDANISLEGGKRVEVKNISSFKEVERALSFEITRQKNLLSNGVRAQMETRHWDETRRVTISLRVKEREEDYRYFPEPDLVPVVISENWIEKIRDKMPELPDAHKERLMKQYGISPQNAEVMVNYKLLGDFFEKCVDIYDKPKEISNWLVGDLLGYLHEKGIEFTELRIGPENITRMIRLIDDGTISGKMAKEVLEIMIDTGKMPDDIIQEKEMIRIHSRKLIEGLADKVFDKYKNAVEDALKDEKALNFLIGKIMEMTDGKADPSLANKVVKGKLAKYQKPTRQTN